MQVLQPGSLLAIGPKTNRQFMHAIPKLEDAVGQRISLSLRSIETFIKFDEKEPKQFVVTGKGAEFQTPNYPFTVSHDDPDMYSKAVKKQIKAATERALGQLAKPSAAAQSDSADAPTPTAAAASSG